MFAAYSIPNNNKTGSCVKGQETNLVKRIDEGFAYTVRTTYNNHVAFKFGVTSLM